jgi:hypothetical protein
MADYGLDADSITRWVIRKSYGIRNPSPDQIARYRDASRSGFIICLTPDNAA